MATYPPFDSSTIEALAKVLGDAGSGSDITQYFKAHNLLDNSGESTKWRRINHVFLEIQKTTQHADKIVDFIRSYLSPTRFIENQDSFDHHRIRLNKVLILCGLEYESNGQFKYVSQAKTIDEAEARVQGICKELESRKAHPEVYKYCRIELMQDNYFHAIFEACKGLFQRIRDISGVEADGALLIDRVFSVDKPLLKFNTLLTETEKSEHKGFAMLLKGCVGAIRNPLAHDPKILWEGETDAVDYLTLISMLHRKLDQCVKVSYPESSMGGGVNA